VSLTRRKLFGWVAALFGGAAVAKAVPAEADALRDLADGELDPTHPYWAGQIAALRGARRVKRGETSLGPFGYADAWALVPIQEQLDEIEHARSTTMGRTFPRVLDEHYVVVRERVGGYVPPDEYVHGVTPGWTFRKYEDNA
jgi:hypothetical protein